MRIDDATIYQIFWMASQNRHKADIARTLGVSRNSVLWHLTGRMIPQYSERLRRRVLALGRPTPRQKPPPDERITLAEASFFFWNRPTSRTILSHYPIRKEHANGMVVTTIEWARQCAMERMPQSRPTGIFATVDAARHLYKTTPTSKIIKLTEIESTETTPASVIHAALGIQQWTEMPYLTITMLDAIYWTTSQSDDQ